MVGEMARAHMRTVLALAVFVLAVFGGACWAQSPTFLFNITPQPQRHNFAVRMRVSGLDAELADFEMPSWMPGYYQIMNYAQYVSHFQARDGQGHALGWEKTTAHTWRVVAAHAPVVVISYDVAAQRPFPADNSIDSGEAFVNPPGTYMYVHGDLARPATVVLHLPAGWRRAATGLAPAAGAAETFYASDFDVLFDSPMLLGNQQWLRFRVNGVPHIAALEHIPASVSRARMRRDLRRIVKAATGIMGVIPYHRYAFLLVGNGEGGIEHLNSQASFFRGASLTTPSGYQSWLSFVAHEYFHCFNVKRIRPLALGPFDYQTQNLTHMLWVAEGLTVYYEDLILVRAGLITPAQYLRTLAGEMDFYENEPGRPYESATESSWRTWNGGYGGRGGTAGASTTISYYDNGAMLGAMLDLAILHDTHDARSLDDVMRLLYHRYYQQDKRGYTDAEFRAACEQVAGHPLPQVFAYAATSEPVDYQEYFAYAGVQVNLTRRPLPFGASIGLDTDTIGATLRVSGVAAGSPAQQAGLRAGDRVVVVNGKAATAAVLSRALAFGSAGDWLDIGYLRGTGYHAVRIPMAARQKLTYTLEPAAHPTPSQQAIFHQWLRDALPAPSARN